MAMCVNGACACRVPPRHSSRAGDLPIEMPLFDIYLEMAINGTVGMILATLRAIQRVGRAPVLAGRGILVIDLATMRMAVILSPMCSGGTIMTIQAGLAQRVVKRVDFPPSAFLEGAVMTEAYAAFLRTKQAVNRRAPLTAAERAFVLCVMQCLRRHALHPNPVLPALPDELQLMILGMLTLGDLSPAPVLAVE